MIKKQSAEEQIATMKHLINYGVNESKKDSSKPVVEFQRKAANGKTYGIIREATKYYIMEAPQKDTEVLAEDFDYIGGFNNRKENEYTSYSKASNALDLKLMSINETVNKKDRIIVEAPKPKADWEDNITESMRKEIDRFKTITANVATILKEDKGIGETPSVAKNNPEAPVNGASEKTKNQPYEVMHSGVADGEKDFTQTSKDHKKAGNPFNNYKKINMESDKAPKGNGDDTYSESPKYGDYGITAQSPKGKNPIGIFENNNNIRLKLTEEQVLAWNKNKDYMDMSHGTEIGDSDPFNDEVDALYENDGDSVVYDHAYDQDCPNGTGDVDTEDGDPFIEIVSEGIDDLDDDVESDEIAGFDDEGDDYFEDSDDEFEIVPDDEIDDSEAYNDDNLNGLDLDNWNSFDDYDDEPLYEVKLNVWGKHPAYRKTPMTIPPNKEVAINGAREWDDESAQGEEPFGKQIGDSSPYDEVVDSLSESIRRSLFRNKKKV